MSKTSFMRSVVPMRHEGSGSTHPASPKTKGPIIAIGGAEDVSGDMRALRHIVDRAGHGRITVITSSTINPGEVGPMYENIFHDLGAQSCTPLFIEDRAAALAPSEDVMNTIRGSDAIFFVGGNQLRLTRILAATPVLEAIRTRHAQGAVLAGTSAGSDAFSDVMTYGGNAENAMIKGETSMAPGLRMLEHAVINTHFLERDRLFRLYEVCASNPAFIGIGVDEDMAAEIYNGEVHAIGDKYVTIVRGRDGHSNLAEVERGEKFDVQGFEVFHLVEGQAFCLHREKPIAAAAMPIPVPA